MIIFFKSILNVLVSFFGACLILTILYVLGTFFDWVEYKQYEKRMNEYLKNKQIKKEFYTSTEPFKKGQEEHIKENYKKALKELAETSQSELPTL
jgi:ABC-type transport system involved in cytochrome bd biosynthesis fused ATPase/permease subunit